MKFILSLLRKAPERYNSDEALEKYIKKRTREEKVNRDKVFPPDFHSLKVLKQEDTIKYYFVNRGSSIYNIELTPLGHFNISIIPSDKIKNNESGCFIIKYLAGQSDDEPKFKITCTTPSSRPIEEIFCCSFMQEKIYRISE